MDSDIDIDTGTLKEIYRKTFRKTFLPRLNIAVDVTTCISSFSDFRLATYPTFIPRVCAFHSIVDDTVLPSTAIDSTHRSFNVLLVKFLFFDFRSANLMRYRTEMRRPATTKMMRASQTLASISNTCRRGGTNFAIKKISTL